MSVFPKQSLRFDAFLEQELKELSPVNPVRQQVLKEYGLHLIADKFPSIKKCADASQEKFNDKMVLQTLNDLKFCEPQLLELRRQLFRTLDKRSAIYLGVDDVTIQKAGKEIAGVQKLFDHTHKTFIDGLLVVDISFRHKGTTYGAQFLLKSPTMNPKKIKGHSKVVEDILKQQRLALVQKLLRTLVRELKVAGFKKKTIWALFDRWYPSAELFRFLREIKISFVVALKKTANVVLPDKASWFRSRSIRRGRKRTHHVREIPIGVFFEQYRSSQWFTPEGQVGLIESKEAQVNLVMVGQVKIIAFRLPTQSEWRFFAASKTLSGAQRAYSIYKKRWPIETVHQDLKEVFGLKEGHMRREDHVIGHMTFVYFLYNTFVKYKAWLQKCWHVTLSAKQLYDHVVASMPWHRDPLQAVCT